jgi:Na+/H+-dicarboxylate symporter
MLVGTGAFMVVARFAGHVGRERELDQSARAVTEIVLLSFATPGLPAGGSNATLGAYLAAGVPLETVVFFEVTDEITDIIKTVLNVVADFAVAVFVSRSLAPSQTRTSSTLSAVSEEPTG